MPESVVNQKVEVNLDFDSLVRRQEELEREINRLRELYKDMKENNSLTIGRVHQRIDELEEEVSDIRQTLNELKASMNLIQSGVNTVQKSVGEINAKQDVAITAQDKFIGQLWRAFFALLGVITVAAGAAFTVFRN
jgi:septation ring formation regulator EzrA